MDWTTEEVPITETKVFVAYRTIMPDTLDDALLDLRAHLESSLINAMLIEEMRIRTEDAIINGTGNTQTRESIPGKPRLLDRQGKFIKEVG